jgi:hypothetical protein
MLNPKLRKLGCIYKSIPWKKVPVDAVASGSKGALL